MDFSVSQFSGDANIPDARVSPLALIKNGYSNTDTNVNCAHNPESAEIFRHLPTNMYANIVSTYTRPEDFSRSYLPYAQSNPTMAASSDGMPFFPYVEAVHHPQSHQRQIDENEHLKSVCSSNQMSANCYYSNETQEYVTENELIIDVEGNYKYESLNTFKDPNEEEEVLGTQMDETLSEWETGTAMVTASSEGIVQSAEVSRAPMNQTYGSGTGNEGLLDYSNHSSASKACNESGGQFCAVDQNISQDQGQKQQVLSAQQFQEPPGVYVTQAMPVPEEQQSIYPPNITCTKSTLFSTMLPYQCISGYPSDQNSAHVEGMGLQNFAAMDPYADEMTRSQIMGMNPDALENSQSQYSCELILF